MELCYVHELSTPHRPPSTSEMGFIHRPPKCVHEQSKIHPMDCPPGGQSTRRVHELEWTVDNPIFLGGRWVVDGGELVNTLG